ncbi:MAG: hypothetical protein C4582_06820 [Desulfobacteraceae bacterium]|nr:MAG: hypothetical protein C4582_06820 [Desulfobacteraceae bacterium]
MNQLMAAEIADIFRRYGDEYRKKHPTTPRQRRVMRDIEQCRTSALGFHADQCNECGEIDISYNSCRNRHCSKMPGHSEAQVGEKKIRRTPARRLLPYSVHPSSPDVSSQSLQSGPDIRATV